MRKIIKSLVPIFLIRIIFNWLAIFNFDIKIGSGSIVRPGCAFGGKNIIMTRSEVSFSRLGRYTYVAHNSILRFTEVGAYCSIGDHVRTCLGIHPTHFFSTHPQTFSINPPTGNAWVSTSTFPEHNYIEPDKKYVVKIGNDVWIGNNVNIMDGVTIGDGAVIASGSIVTKDVEAYSIVAGVPAKPLKKRFDDEKIEKLLDLKWWEKSDEWVKNNLHTLRSL